MALWFLTVLAGLGTGMMLALAAMPLDWPVMLWPLVHWTVLVTGLGLAAHAARRGNGQMAIAFVTLVLVYNPVTAFGGESPLWSLVGLFAAVPFLVYPWMVPRPVFGRASAVGDPSPEEGVPADPDAIDHEDAPPPGATDAEVQASARDMFERYGPKAVAVAKARHGQLVKAGRTRMAAEWAKLAKALDALVDGAEPGAKSDATPAPDASPAEQPDGGDAAAPVDIDFEEVEDPPKPGDRP